jgi:hypothetical protein
VKHLKSLLLCSLLGLASAQVAASCYTVYDRSGGVVYHESNPPVDMSRPLHEALSARFPGGHMIFDMASDCAHIIVTATARSLSSRLLTDQQTALDMQLPYTLLDNGMALVWTGPRASRAR